MSTYNSYARKKVIHLLASTKYNSHVINYNTRPISASYTEDIIKPTMNANIPLPDFVKNNDFSRQTRESVSVSPSCQSCAHFIKFESNDIDNDIVSPFVGICAEITPVFGASLIRKDFGMNCGGDLYRFKF